MNGDHHQQQRQHLEGEESRSLPQPQRRQLHQLGPVQSINHVNVIPNEVDCGISRNVSLENQPTQQNRQQSAVAAAQLPPTQVIQLWQEVSDGLDRSSTVVWVKAVESLETARRYLQPPLSSPEARNFVDKCIITIISILLEQQPNKIGQTERECVEKSVKCALAIVRDDLQTILESKAPATRVCTTLQILSHVFNKKKFYYKGPKANWSAGPLGLPEIRSEMIWTFRRMRGFHLLGLYLTERASLVSKNVNQNQGSSIQQQQQLQATTLYFPPFDVIHNILDAIKEEIPLNSDHGSSSNCNNNSSYHSHLKEDSLDQVDQSSKFQSIKQDALLLAQAVMKHLSFLDEDTLKRVTADTIKATCYHLQRLYERLSLSNPRSLFDYYTFSRSLVLKLITSASLPLKLSGWAALEEIIEASVEKRPPPRAYIVSGAGLEVINGRYDFDPKKRTDDGWVKNGTDISYVRRVPSDGVEEENGSGNGTVIAVGAMGPKSTAISHGHVKTLTLFRCTMRSQQRWWFLSEADEDQPGTDKDIDYYQHKSKSHEEAKPPNSGWVTCRSGVDPPPTLIPVGVMVPDGEEYNTLEHELAKWAIENKVIELVLGDSIHREIVARSTALIKFLASMCDKDDPVDAVTSKVNESAAYAINVQVSAVEKNPNQYCLKASHLLLAWKTCMSKADAAVSTEIYNLLVSILPTLPEDLAIPLIRAIQESLIQTSDRGNHNFFEVSEFCCAIAFICEGDSKSDSLCTPISIKTKVREEILSLQWAILTHEDAWSLKSYDNIKKYVSSEIFRTDTVAEMMRDKFFHHCRDAVAKSLGPDSIVNETHALYMVQLTRFVLEAYPRDVTGDINVTKGVSYTSLAELLFLELRAYLKRRRTVPTAPPLRKVSSTALVVPEFNHSAAFSERLQILRFAYGLSNTAKMTFQNLDQIWSLCTSPVDKEAIMDFLANASNACMEPIVRSDTNMNRSEINHFNSLHAAFSNDVCIKVFQKLFCAEDVGWESLGEVAFRSFQILFKSLSFGIMHDSAINERALDALWRICLSAGNDNVATSAMTELLNVYFSVVPKNLSNDSSENNIEHIGASGGDRFSRRIFECLCDVKDGLQKGDKASERSAERCIRILNAAFNLSTLGGGVTTIISRLQSLLDCDLNAYLNLIPHGLRGLSSCKTVSVMTKKITTHGNTSSNDLGTQRFTLEVHLLQSLAAIKIQIASHCDHDVQMVKITNVSGRLGNPGRQCPRPNFGTFLDTTIAADLGISDGSELVVVLSDKVADSGPIPSSPVAQLCNANNLDLTGLFDTKSEDESFGLFFDTLISVLESLPVSEDDGNKRHAKDDKVNTHSLVWDLLLAMPTNVGVSEKVLKVVREGRLKLADSSADAMVVDFVGENSDWFSLIDFQHFERSVYVLQVIDSFLRPPPYLFTSLSPETAQRLDAEMMDRADKFHSQFISSGGFESVLRLFVESGTAEKETRRRNRMGNACALRILSTCFLSEKIDLGRLDVLITNEGREMLEIFPNIGDFLKSLVYIIVDDEGVEDAAILRVLRLVEMLLKSGQRFISSFAILPENVTEKFFTSLLLWEGSSLSPSTTSIQSAMKIRRTIEDMIIAEPLLSKVAFPCLVKALKSIDPYTDGSNEFFSVLIKLVGFLNRSDYAMQLKDLGLSICNKLASYPISRGGNEIIDFSTGVLCGCLKLLISLVNAAGGTFLHEGSNHLLQSLKNVPWSQQFSENQEWKDVESRINADDLSLINLMGSIFDGFVSSSRSPGLLPICCDKESRHLSFSVVAAAAGACTGGLGYNVLVNKISSIISDVAPTIRHIWGQNATFDDGVNQQNPNAVKYSGLKNQGCTCYMNSVLQQLFMMPALRKNLCSADIPVCLRSSGGGVLTKREDLVGKKISLHWDCGNNYDAIVDNFDIKTGMHTIRYLPVQLASSYGQQPLQLPDGTTLPKELPEQFILCEGRPGKETGAFEILSNKTINETSKPGESLHTEVTETLESIDEASSRKLLEEIQRTFVNLNEARGRCFDPRSLVEASNCLKLEFDVWQQNDASEFAMKLLDRLEISLKKWSPSVFKYLAHTFGLKTTKQKICKECGLKTNREEKLMNIDCQIRNKSTIQEALSTLCEDEIMEGDNKVLCERCKVKTNTVLRTAISTLPDVLVLSLKRFDLDYTTFETVKLNSRCEFGQALNMKQYTLEAKEILEAVVMDQQKSAGFQMECGNENENDHISKDPLSILPDKDYEYLLAGVLVHAGVAQGGHYYSFIKDRTSDKWYRFDDEDVTPFDPTLIEQECFGGKVKKETKFPNGHVHTVENEQFANALMLFYEKLNPVEAEDVTEQKVGDTTGTPMDEAHDSLTSTLALCNGFDVFLPSVRKSNSTHSWQSFLLTHEFQSFIRDILDLSITMTIQPDEQDRMDITPLTPHESISTGGVQECWRCGVVKMALSFLFDVLFHLSLDKKTLNDWSSKILQIFSMSMDLVAAFVKDLAKRTHLVHENWIRAYVVECPEEAPRRTALQIFASAIHLQMSQPIEQSLLQTWTRGWHSQWAEREKISKLERQLVGPGPMPTKLEDGQLCRLEDISGIGKYSTCVGIILSFLTVLMELSPRIVQSKVDIFYFIKMLARFDSPEGKILRDAMAEAQFPARLLCLGLREKSHRVLQHFYPGACLSCEVAEAISKNETNSSNILQVGMSNSGINGGGNQFSPDSLDNRLLLEALGTLLGMPWCVLEEIIYDTGEVLRGRPIIRLTPLATNALSIVFNESKSSSIEGMTKRDIQFFMKKCGILDVPLHKIEHIMNRYAVMDDKDGIKVLPLDGFLEYYQIQSANNEFQVQQELQLFGFRPNLSRLLDDARWFQDEATGHMQSYTMFESIANDVYMNHLKLTKSTPFLHHHLSDSSFFLFAMEINRTLADYIQAAYDCGKDSTQIIAQFLGIFHRRQVQWNTELYQTCHSVFAILAGIPDERQPDRITKIMLNGDKDNEGLMVFGQKVFRRYPNDCNGVTQAEKYVHIIQELKRQRAVMKWMNENRSKWLWMEPNVGLEAMNNQQSRVEYSDCRDGIHHNQSVPHSDNSDDDYEDDEEDSRFDQENTINEVIVDGCGIAEINGIYRRCGSCDYVPKYSKPGRWRGLNETFMLFRCRLSDKTRRWYISIVPPNINPGTTKDTDFYFVPNRAGFGSSIPPSDGWSTIPQKGIEPPPRLTPKTGNEWNETTTGYL